MLVATFQNSCKSTKIIKKMKKANITKSVLAGLFSTVTIGVLTLLTYKTEFGVFLIASFGSSMVLLFGYPESPFAQPKNIFFGHLLTTLVGIIFVTFFEVSFISIGLAVGIAIMLMIALKVTHPPAGGNPIAVMIGGVSFPFLIFPILAVAITIVIGGIIYNSLILKRKYPISWK